jgi:hypothetical protein
MSIDVDVLVESYTILKQYIPAKERQEAADNLVSMLVDTLSESQLKEFSIADNYTKRAVQEYSIEEDEDYEDYEE